MCDECLATNPANIGGNGYLSYMNFSRDAGWRETLIDNDSYLLETPFDHLSAFLQVEGHCKDLCWRDFAHLDPLGLGRDLGPALIKSMHLRKELGDGDLEAQLRRLWGEFQQDRRDRGRCRIAGCLTPSNTGMDNM